MAAHGSSFNETRRGSLKREPPRRKKRREARESASESALELHGLRPGYAGVQANAILQKGMQVANSVLDPTRLLQDKFLVLERRLTITTVYFVEMEACPLVRCVLHPRPTTL